MLLFYIERILQRLSLLLAANSDQNTEKPETHPEGVWLHSLLRFDITEVAPVVSVGNSKVGVGGLQQTLLRQLLCQKYKT